MLPADSFQNTQGPITALTFLNTGNSWALEFDFGSDQLTT